MFSHIINLIQTFNSDVAPEQISLGIAFAMIAGLTPFWSLHNLLVLLLVMLLRVNVTSFFAALALFSLLAFALDPLFHHLGYLVLTLDTLSGLWEILYNITLWRIEHFNNTVVMGSLLFSLLMFVPVYAGSIWTINRYREHILAWFKTLSLRRWFTLRFWRAKFGLFRRTR